MGVLGSGGVWRFGTPLPQAHDPEGRLKMMPAAAALPGRWSSCPAHFSYFSYFTYLSHLTHFTPAISPHTLSPSPAS